MVVECHSRYLIPNRDIFVQVIYYQLLVTTVPTLILILGPTAVGKTAYAIQMAQRLGTEIVSCDSRQCYREMNIGVARPSVEELEAVSHHFIANRSVLQPYNVYSYEQEAMECLSQLFRCYDTVVAVGGSGLYADALCNGVSNVPDPLPGLREQLQQRLQYEGLASLQQELKQRDPDYYNKVDLRNPVRVQRALEICITTGRPYSQVINQPASQRPFNIRKLGLCCDRAVLKERIALRTQKMMQDGLLKETLDVLPYRHLQALNTVGYKELFEYFDHLQMLTGKDPGTFSVQQMEEATPLVLQKTVQNIVTHTWQYAKKQLSYFARDPHIEWIMRK